MIFKIDKLSKIIYTDKTQNDVLEMQNVLYYDISNRQYKYGNVKIKSTDNYQSNNLDIGGDIE